MFFKSLFKKNDDHNEKTVLMNQYHECLARIKEIERQLKLVDSDTYDMLYDYLQSNIKLRSQIFVKIKELS